ncbi:MAG: hypothetical protein WC455_30240, partial [Dehalococcoidia bacterium]
DITGMPAPMDVVDALEREGAITREERRELAFSLHGLGEQGERRFNEIWQRARTAVASKIESGALVVKEVESDIRPRPLGSLAPHLTDVYFSYVVTTKDGHRLSRPNVVMESVSRDRVEAARQSARDGAVFEIARRYANKEMYRIIESLLKRKGYDGLVYPNKQEGGGKSYAVFDPDRISVVKGNPVGLKKPWEMTESAFRANTPNGFRYVSDLPREADVHTGVIRVGPKFFRLSEGGRKGVITHEHAHALETSLTTPQWSELMDIAKQDVGSGLGVLNRREYHGPLGRVDKETGLIESQKIGERLTDLYASMLEGEDAWLKTHYPIARRKIVEFAAANGLYVPGEVMKDYPELNKNPSGKRAWNMNRQAVNPKRERLVDVVGNEVIMHGGIPLRRKDVYTLALSSTGSEQAAGMFAFGNRHEPVDVEPWNIEDAKALFKMKNPTWAVYPDGRRVEIPDVVKYDPKRDFVRKTVAKPMYDLNGFENTMSPAMAAKADAFLNTKIRINGVFESRKHYVEKEIEYGSTVGIREKQPAIINGTVTYMLQKNIGKTAIDYARYLLSLKTNNPTGRRQPTVFKTTCKRCGKPIYASTRFVNHPLSRICVKCVMPGERKVLRNPESIYPTNARTGEVFAVETNDLGTKFEFCVKRLENNVYKVYMRSVHDGTPSEWESALTGTGRNIDDAILKWAERWNIGAGRIESNNRIVLSVKNKAAENKRIDAEVNRKAVEIQQAASARRVQYLSRLSTIPIKGRKGTIAVTFEAPDEHGNKAKNIEATIFGEHFAVHKDAWSGHYIITHLPTGFSLAKDIPMQSMAKDIIKGVYDIGADWSSKDVKQIHPDTVKAVRQIKDFVLHYGDAPDYAVRKAANPLSIGGTESSSSPSSLYQSFHGNPSKGTRRVRINIPEPGDKLVKIGRLTELRYRPENPSQHVGTEFFHRLGDTGTMVLKNKPILATGPNGKGLFIINDKASPTFTKKGIIG